LIGTTDTPIENPELEPVALEKEIEFILSTAALYLAKAPTRADVLSVFAGIRPLVKAQSGVNTATLSRDHTIHIDQSGLLSICGGKWTTYRRMAEDCVNQAAMLANLPTKECVTEHLNIHGFHAHPRKFGELSAYGSDALPIQALMRDNPDLSTPLNPALPYTGAEVIWAVRSEMAETVEDVLARRTRALFLNAPAAIKMADRVAGLMAAETKKDAEWRDQQVRAFLAVAQNYVLGRTRD
jgi:glycerol-3-phosphate dehydrogenase